MHGIPYVKAKKFDSETIPELFKMLENPDFKESEPNIISIIGMIGDDSAFIPLKNYFEKQRGEISGKTFRALLIVFQSFGHMGNKGNKEVIKYLEKWCDSSYLESAKVNFTFKGYENEDLVEIFGRMAIQGLGISGTPEAYSVLAKVDRKVDQLREEKGWEWSDNTREAMKLNLRIRNEGISKVFDKTHNK